MVHRFIISKPFFFPKNGHPPKWLLNYPSAKPPFDTSILQKQYMMPLFVSVSTGVIYTDLLKCMEALILD